MTITLRHPNRRGSRPAEHLSNRGNGDSVFEHLGCRRMSQIVKPQSGQGTYDITHLRLALGTLAGIAGALKPSALRAFHGGRGVVPSRPPVAYRTGGINLAILASGKNKVIGLTARET